MHCCSVAKASLTLCDPMDCSRPGSSVLHYLLELLKFMSIELVMLQYQLYISYIFSFSISYIGHYKCLHCLKKLKVKLPCDPAILLLGEYPKDLKTETQTDACV